MTQGSKTSAKTSADGDLEAVSQQLAALREDMAKLGETVKAIAGRRGSSMAADIVEGFDEAKQYTKRTGRSAEDQFEQSVAAHPLLAIALAAGVGLLVGALSRR